MAPLQPNHTASIQRFLEWQKASFRMGTLGPKEEESGQYIPRSALDNYFNSHSRVKEILNDLLPGHAVDASYVWKHYRWGFAILLSIDAGSYIREFVEHPELQDIRLPFAETPPKGFPASNDDTLFASFYRQQWRYFPKELMYGMRGEIPQNVILPIQVQEKLGRGVSANVYKIEVDKEYNNLGHQVGSPQAGYFVLKTYHGKNAERNFKIEKDAFERLNQTPKPPEHIVRFHGSFTRADTHSLILEYADRGTLRDYMQDNAPPSSGGDILKLWSHLIKLVLGLQTLHENGDDLGSQVMSGWHQDIKPTNILVKSREGATSVYDVEFVLADLGLSHFKLSNSHNKGLTDRDTYGTHAYGAPEAHRIDRAMADTRVSVLRVVDIWSLGCIYSEVATWIAHGWSRVEQYRKQRQMEVEKKFNDPESGDLFHDGEKVLEAVEDSHASVHESRRIDDFITPRMVKEVISEMLESPRVRMDAHQVYNKAYKSLVAARKELEAFRSHRSSFLPSSDGIYDHSTIATPVSEKFQQQQQATTDDRMGPPSPEPSQKGEASARTIAMKNQGQDSLPRISVKEVLKWKTESKMGIGMPRQLPDHDYLNTSIKGRDSVFLIDNSASMLQYKVELKNVLMATAYLVKKYDDDGVDQLYTQTDRILSSTKRTTAMVDELNKISFWGKTDMEVKLGAIFEDYKRKISPDKKSSGWFSRFATHSSKKLPRKLSLYIFTDGHWQPGCDVESVIKSMVNFLVQHDLRNKQVAIQFIRFGPADADVIRQLERLDDGLGLDLDIVDTTPSNGNIWKMILGAVNTWFDKHNDHTDL